MSHVVEMEMGEITDLGVLAEAAEMIGMTAAMASTYKWFGSHVGDYPLPAGFTAADLGTCDMKISVDGKPDSYEVGVKAKRDGSGYALLMDFWGFQGKELAKAVGEPEGALGYGWRLRQAYAAAAQAKEARRNGYRVDRSTNERGEIVLRVRA